GQFLATEKILAMRTVDGARAVGLEHAIGSLEPGKRADVVIRSQAAPETVPAVNPVQELLLGGQATTVDTVLVDGEIVWRDGRPTRVDLDAVTAAGRACARSVLKRAGYAPRAGCIRIGGRDGTRLPAAHRNVGLVFQSYALFPHMTVSGNVAFPLRVRHLPHGEIDRRVAAVLRLVRLSGLEGRKPHQLSG